MQTIIQRLLQPSTHAGLGLLLIALAHLFPEYAMILNAVAACFGGSAVALNEAPKQ